MGRQRRWATPARRGAISQVTSRPAAAQHLRDPSRLRRGDLSVTEVCFAVGCSSLGTFSSRFTELVGVPPSVYRRQAARATAGDAVARGETGDQTDQESRSAVTEPHLA
jgi:Helix-turn-helix domain